MKKSLPFNNWRQAKQNALIGYQSMKQSIQTSNERLIRMLSQKTESKMVVMSIIFSKILLPSGKNIMCERPQWNDCKGKI